MRIAAVAIAKDEGPYLADWVHHHLYFGFSHINVWINGTSDSSQRILQQVNEHHPSVNHRIVDDLMADSRAGAGMFQHLAYDGLARWAERELISHVAFLDIDEYWTPVNFRTPVSEFLSETPNADVISFPWYIDEADAERQPFDMTFTDTQKIFANQHVKSIVRRTNRVQKYLTHTALVRDGIKLLVDTPLEIVDETAQAHGSKVGDAQLTDLKKKFPKAFIYHRMHRAQLEYVATLAKGMAQAGSKLPLKKNRHGFVNPTGSGLEFRPPAAALESYAASRARFHDVVGVKDLVSEARAFAAGRAREVIELAAKGKVDSTLADQVLLGVDRDLLSRQAGALMQASSE
ncbi:glycosyltransferase family 2 protein [Brachybacterium sp. J153]|uniref:glycosyltransferase family 2 protein n=1 Tax=Brachybacterium sp. J153 TaxID=3116488 RepID=UPI002E75E951|nr:glycosyltransferase family 2 protein [Brachybacterium sp. J153]MEE1617830.1 glycosyltransferase family 2 protein [Brachybacterium sp. J153]